LRRRREARIERDLEVKTPTESKGPWDYFKVRATIPAEEAFRPLSEGGCSFVDR
jgi:branched-chain amino acid transport system substrate-binding protein